MQLKAVCLITLMLGISSHLSADVKPPRHKDIIRFLKEYNTIYQSLYTQSSEAAWAVNTRIIPGDTILAYHAQKADEAMAAFTGSADNIETARRFLTSAEITPLERKQLEKILYLAAGNPQTMAPLVTQRIKAETKQTQMLYGYDYILDGHKVSTNQIDSILQSSGDLMLRLRAWEVSKGVGKILKDSLLSLRDLRNGVVQGLGYADFFGYQVSDYGMKTDEMMLLNRQFLQELWPLYRELHTYARYTLAAKFGTKEVPDLLPAHWLPNRWGQDWSSIVNVKGMNLDSALGKHTPQWIVERGEAFYKSLGFPALPSSFYAKSSLYPLPANIGYSKNNHASAWHMNLDRDVRSLMSVEANEEWYGTVNHELGHIYYYLTYSNKNVPPLLREGANRAYHEAFGTMIGLAALQKPFLRENGLLPAEEPSDDTQELLKQALQYVVFQPFSNVMTEFEHDFYVNRLPADGLNKRWWQLVAQYQGIAPPSERGEEFCDAATKTHINDDPAQYYDYGLAAITLFQVHNHIAREILKQDPHNCNYFNSKTTGDFLRNIMYYGSSRDWREVLKANTGSELSAAAMVEYFQPLMTYLRRVNAGRKYTLPEHI